MYLRKDEKVIASEKDVTVTIGSSSTHDAFDIYLVKLTDGNYTLIIFMKIQFFFKDGSGGKWISLEKSDFVRKWQLRVKDTWGGRTLKILDSGKTINLEFRFEAQIGCFMWDHWEITVTKVNKFTTSYVVPSSNQVTLDSRDIQLTLKQGGESQYGVTHEFGHMLGLSDEYLSDSPFSKDYKSIMHSGETIFDRHDMPYMQWLDKNLPKE